MLSSAIFAKAPNQRMSDSYNPLNQNHIVENSHATREEVMLLSNYENKETGASGMSQSLGPLHDLVTW